MVSVLTLLAGLPACTDEAEPDLGDCPAYLECAASTGTPTATLEATYGEDGLCWDDTDDAQVLCRAGCTDALTVLQQAFPEDEVCGAAVDAPGFGPDDCGSISPTGGWIGEVPADFSGPDQNGDVVHLHDYCARAVLLFFDFTWDPNLGTYAEGAQDMQDEFAREDFTALGVFVEMDGEEPPSQEDLAQLADDHGLTFPLIADDDFQTATYFWHDRFPAWVLLGPGPVVLDWDNNDGIDRYAVQVALP